jgi:hypothetical protein
MLKSETQGREIAFEVNLTERQLRNFWEKVDRTSSPHGCWLWTAGGKRYGKFWYPKLMAAHRVSWCLAHGPIFSDKPFVLHNCPGGDTTKCVNPAHLWVGTQKENIHDCIERGNFSPIEHPERNLRGEKSPKAKLSESDVLMARRMREHGQTYDSIGRHFGVHLSTIAYACSGVNWKHVA